MQNIIAPIIAGLFSLAGIWYQNYLSTKRAAATAAPAPLTAPAVSTNEEKAPPAKSNRDFRPLLRILFTILIVAIPWLSFNYLLRFMDVYTFNHSHTRHATQHNLVIVRNEIAAYCIVWFLITAAALLSGWKKKTIFEKIILMGSGVWLIYIGYTRCSQYNKLITFNEKQHIQTVMAILG